MSAHSKGTVSRVVRIAMILAGLAAALLCLHGPAASALPLPADGTGIGTWFSTTEPAIAFMTYLRVIALGLGWYLAALMTAHLLLSLLGIRSALIDRLTPAALRPLVGLAITAATLPGLAAPALAEQLDDPTPPVTMVRLDPPGPGGQPTPSTAPRSEPAPVPTMTMIGLGEATEPSSQNPAPDRATWRVAEGQHFWSIAEQVVNERLQRSATENEIDSYWRLLIATNTDRLVDQQNPDLLVVGQVLDLPK